MSKKSTSLLLPLKPIDYSQFQGANDEETLLNFKKAGYNTNLTESSEFIGELDPMRRKLMDEEGYSYDDAKAVEDPESILASKQSTPKMLWNAVVGGAIKLWGGAAQGLGAQKELGDWFGNGSDESDPYNNQLIAYGEQVRNYADDAYAIYDKDKNSFNGADVAKGVQDTGYSIGLAVPTMAESMIIGAATNALEGAIMGSFVPGAGNVAGGTTGSLVGLGIGAGRGYSAYKKVKAIMDTYRKAKNFIGLNKNISVAADLLVVGQLGAGMAEGVIEARDTYANNYQKMLEAGLTHENAHKAAKVGADKVFLHNQTYNFANYLLDKALLSTANPLTGQIGKMSAWGQVGAIKGMDFIQENVQEQYQGQLQKYGEYATLKELAGYSSDKATKDEVGQSAFKEAQKEAYKSTSGGAMKYLHDNFDWNEVRDTFVMTTVSQILMSGPTSFSEAKSLQNRRDLGKEVATNMLDQATSANINAAHRINAIKNEISQIDQILTSGSTDVDKTSLSAKKASLELVLAKENENSAATRAIINHTLDLGNNELTEENFNTAISQVDAKVREQLQGSSEQEVVAAIEAKKAEMLELKESKGNRVDSTLNYYDSIINSTEATEQEKYRAQQAKEVYQMTVKNLKHEYKSLTDKSVVDAIDLALARTNATLSAKRASEIDAVIAQNLSPEQQVIFGTNKDIHDEITLETSVKEMEDAITVREANINRILSESQDPKEIAVALRDFNKVQSLKESVKKRKEELSEVRTKNKSVIGLTDLTDEDLLDPKSQSYIDNKDTIESYNKAKEEAKKFRKEVKLGTTEASLNSTWQHQANNLDELLSNKQMHLNNAEENTDTYENYYAYEDEVSRKYASLANLSDEELTSKLEDIKKGAKWYKGTSGVQNKILANLVTKLLEARNAIAADEEVQAQAEEIQSRTQLDVLDSVIEELQKEDGDITTKETEIKETIDRVNNAIHGYKTREELIDRIFNDKKLFADLQMVFSLLSNVGTKTNEITESQKELLANLQIQIGKINTIRMLLANNDLNPANLQYVLSESEFNEFMDTLIEEVITKDENGVEVKSIKSKSKKEIHQATLKKYIELLDKTKKEINTTKLQNNSKQIELLNNLVSSSADFLNLRREQTQEKLEYLRILKERFENREVVDQDLLSLISSDIVNTRSTINNINDTFNYAQTLLSVFKQLDLSVKLTRINSANYITEIHQEIIKNIKEIQKLIDSDKKLLQDFPDHPDKESIQKTIDQIELFVKEATDKNNESDNKLLYQSMVALLEIESVEQKNEEELNKELKKLQPQIDKLNKERNAIDPDSLIVPDVAIEYDRLTNELNNLNATAVALNADYKLKGKEAIDALKQNASKKLGQIVKDLDTQQRMLASSEFIKERIENELNTKQAVANANPLSFQPVPENFAPNEEAIRTALQDSFDTAKAMFSGIQKKHAANNTKSLSISALTVFSSNSLPEIHTVKGHVLDEYLRHSLVGNVDLGEYLKGLLATVKDREKYLSNIKVGDKSIFEKDSSDQWKVTKEGEEFLSDYAAKIKSELTKEGFTVFTTSPDSMGIENHTVEYKKGDVINLVDVVDETTKKVISKGMVGENRVFKLEMFNGDKWVEVKDLDTNIEVSFDGEYRITGDFTGSSDIIGFKQVDGRWVAAIIDLKVSKDASFDKHRNQLITYASMLEVEEDAIGCILKIKTTMSGANENTIITFDPDATSIILDSKPIQITKKVSEEELKGAVSNETILDPGFAPALDEFFGLVDQIDHELLSMSSGEINVTQDKELKENGKKLLIGILANKNEGESFAGAFIKSFLDNTTKYDRIDKLESTLAYSIKSILHDYKTAEGILLKEELNLLNAYNSYFQGKLSSDPVNEIKVGASIRNILNAINSYNNLTQGNSSNGSRNLTGKVARNGASTAPKTMSEGTVNGNITVRNPSVVFNTVKGTIGRNINPSALLNDSLNYDPTVATSLVLSGELAIGSTINFNPMFNLTMNDGKLNPIESNKNTFLNGVFRIKNGAKITLIEAMEDDKELSQLVVAFVNRKKDVFNEIKDKNPELVNEFINNVYIVSSFGDDQIGNIRNPSWYDISSNLSGMSIDAIKEAKANTRSFREAYINAFLNGSHLQQTVQQISGGHINREAIDKTDGRYEPISNMFNLTNVTFGATPSDLIFNQTDNGRKLSFDAGSESKAEVWLKENNQKLSDGLPKYQIDGTKIYQRLEKGKTYFKIKNHIENSYFYIEADIKPMSHILTSEEVLFNDASIGSMKTQMERLYDVVKNTNLTSDFKNYLMQFFFDSDSIAYAGLMINGNNLVLTIPKSDNTVNVSTFVNEIKNLTGIEVNGDIIDNVNSLNLTELIEKDQLTKEQFLILCSKLTQRQHSQNLPGDKAVFIGLSENGEQLKFDGKDGRKAYNRLDLRLYNYRTNLRPVKNLKGEDVNSQEITDAYKVSVFDPSITLSFNYKEPSNAERHTYLTESNEDVDASIPFTPTKRQLDLIDNIRGKLVRRTGIYREVIKDSDGKIIKNIGDPYDHTIIPTDIKATENGYEISFKRTLPDGTIKKFFVEVDLDGTIISYNRVKINYEPGKPVDKLDFSEFEKSEITPEPVTTLAPTPVEKPIVPKEVNVELSDLALKYPELNNTILDNSINVESNQNLYHDLISGKSTELLSMSNSVSRIITEENFLNNTIQSLLKSEVIPYVGYTNNTITDETIKKVVKLVTDKLEERINGLTNTLNQSYNDISKQQIQATIDRLRLYQSLIPEMVENNKKSIINQGLLVEKVKDEAYDKSSLTFNPKTSGGNKVKLMMEGVPVLDKDGNVVKTTFGFDKIYSSSEIYNALMSRFTGKPLVVEPGQAVTVAFRNKLVEMAKSDIVSKAILDNLDSITKRQFNNEPNLTDKEISQSNAYREMVSLTNKDILRALKLMITDDKVTLMNVANATDKDVKIKNFTERLGKYAPTKELELALAKEIKNKLNEVSNKTSLTPSEKFKELVNILNSYGAELNGDYLANDESFVNSIVSKLEHTSTEKEVVNIKTLVAESGINLLLENDPGLILGAGNIVDGGERIFLHIERTDIVDGNYELENTSKDANHMLNKDPFSKGSLLVKHFEDFSAKAIKLGVSHLPIAPYKEVTGKGDEKVSLDSEGIQKLTNDELLMLQLGAYLSTATSKSTHASFMFPTVSDKKSQFWITVPLLTKIETSKVNQYKELITADVSRIFHHLKNNPGDTKSMRAKFLAIEELNKVEINTSNIIDYINSWIKSPTDENGVAINVDKITDKDLINHLMTVKFNDKLILATKLDELISNKAKNLKTKLDSMTFKNGSTKLVGMINEFKGTDVNIQNFIINDMLALIESFRVYSGDIALYAKEDINSTFDNLGKRLAAQSAPGTSSYGEYLHIQLSDVKYQSEYLMNLLPNGLVKQAEIDKYYKNVNALVVEQQKETKDQSAIDNLKLEIDAFKSKIGNYADYLDIESTDAQEYCTWREHIERSFSYNQITPLEKDLLVDYFTIEEDESLSEADRKRKIDELFDEPKYKSKIVHEDGPKYIIDKFVSQPMKTVHSGKYWNENKGYMEYVYIKSSTIPLFPHLTRGLPLNDLRISLQEIESKHGMSVRASYSTANKVGTIKQFSIWNEDGSFKTGALDELKNGSKEGHNFKSMLILDGNHLKLQTATPFKTKTEITLGSQLNKVVFGKPLFDKLGDVEFTKLFNDYKTNFNNLTSIYLKEFENELGFPLTHPDGYVIDDFVNNYYKSAGDNTRERQNRFKQVFKNIGKLLNDELAKDSYSETDRLENKVTARVIDKNGVESTIVYNVQNLDEYTVIDKPRFNLPLWALSKSAPIETFFNSIINSRYGNIKLPGYSFILGSDAGFNSKQAINSIEDIKDKSQIRWFDSKRVNTQLEFMKEENGEVFTEVLAPSKIKVGDKYIDIANDSRYWNEDGSLNTKMLPEEMLYAIGFRIPTSGLMSGLRMKIVGFLPVASGDVLIVPSEITKQQGADYDIDKENLYFKNYTVEDDGKITVVKDDSKEGVSNKLIDNYHAIYKNPIMKSTISSTLNTNFFAQAVEKAREGVVKPIASGTNRAYFNNKLEAGAAGKLGVGASSMDITYNAIFESLVATNPLKTLSLKISLKDEDKGLSVNGKEYSLLGTGTMKVVSDEYKNYTIAEHLAEFQQITVDNEKLQYMADLGVNDVTLDACKVFNLLGIHSDEEGNWIPALLFNHPVVKKEIERQKLVASNSLKESVAIAEPKFDKSGSFNLKIKNGELRNLDSEVLNIFLGVQQLGRRLRSLMTKYNADSKGVDISTMNNMKKQDSNAVDLGINLTEHPVISYSTKLTKLGSEFTNSLGLTPSYYLLDRTSIDVAGKFYYYEIDENTSKNVKDVLDTYVGASLFSDLKTSEDRKNFMNRTNERYKSIVNTDNEVLKTLVKSSELFKLISYEDSHDRLIKRPSLIEEFEKDDVINSFKNLYHNYGNEKISEGYYMKDFLLDLIKYSYVVNSSVSLYDLQQVIPYEFKEALGINSMVRTLELEMNNNEEFRAEVLFKAGALVEQLKDDREFIPEEGYIPDFNEQGEVIDRKSKLLKTSLGDSTLDLFRKRDSLLNVSKVTDAERKLIDYLRDVPSLNINGVNFYTNLLIQQAKSISNLDNYSIKLLSNEQMLIDTGRESTSTDRIHGRYKNNTIYINSEDTVTKQQETLSHELTHLIMSDSVNTFYADKTDPVKNVYKERVVKLMNKLKEPTILSSLPDTTLRTLLLQNSDNYALLLNELLAELYSNPTFRDKLAGITYETDKSILDRFKDIMLSIMRAIGLKPDTALYEAISLSLEFTPYANSVGESNSVFDMNMRVSSGITSKTDIDLETWSKLKRNQLLKLDLLKTIRDIERKVDGIENNINKLEDIVRKLNEGIINNETKLLLEKANKIINGSQVKEVSDNLSINELKTNGLNRTDGLIKLDVENAEVFVKKIFNNEQSTKIFNFIENLFNEEYNVKHESSDKFSNFRRSMYFSDTPYNYSGTTRPANIGTDELNKVIDIITEQLGFDKGYFDMILINEYTSGSQKIGFHTDNEAILNNKNQLDPTVVTISFGDERTMILQGTDGVKHSVPMTNGMGLIMGAGSQLNYKHGINNEQNKGKRFSITLRHNAVKNNSVNKTSVPQQPTLSGFKGYKGGFEDKGKGTPEGDGKDKAMRQVANGFIGELGKATPSSTLTSAAQIFKMSQDTVSAAASFTKSKVAIAPGSLNDNATIIMLARNKSGREGTPLSDDVKTAILNAHNNGVEFVVGDMPNVDSQFIDYLQEIGAKFTIYHTGSTPRIKINQPVPQQSNKSDIEFQVEESGANMREMYLNRTAKNASADVTLDFGLNQEGESWTKKAVDKNKKRYIGINSNNLTITPELVNRIVTELNNTNAKSINIAGMGIYNMKSVTQEQVDKYVYDVLKAVLESPNLKTKIESIRTGGQTGFDEAGAKTSQKLGIRTLILAPKGFTFRDATGKDISNEQQFKARFDIIPQQSNEVVSESDKSATLFSTSSNQSSNNISNDIKEQLLDTKYLRKESKNQLKEYLDKQSIVDITSDKLNDPEVIAEIMKIRC